MSSRFWSFFLLCLLMTVPALAGRIYLEPDHPRYVNGRYGFSLTLPPGQWEVMEAENGDGITASDDETAAERVEVRVYGTRGYSVLGQSFDDALAEALQKFGAVEKKLVDAQAGFFTIRGRDGQNNLFYFKCFFGKEEANIATIACPRQWQASFDVLIEAMEKTFRPGFRR